MGRRAACDQMQGGELRRPCVDVSPPDGGICVKLCLIWGVRMMRVFILGNYMPGAQRVAIIKVGRKKSFPLPAQTKRGSLSVMDS